MNDEKPSLPNRCPQCGYSLDGILSSTCPECGIDTDLLRDSLFRDHVESMLNTSVCYALAGSFWLVIAFILGFVTNNAFIIGIVSPVFFLHFLVGYVIYQGRYRLLGGTRYMRHSSILSVLSLLFSLLMLALTMTTVV